MDIPFVRGRSPAVVLLLSLWCVACAATGAPTATAPATVVSTTRATPSPFPFSLPYEQAVHLFDYAPGAPLDLKEISKKDYDGASARSLTYAAHRPDYGINGRILLYLVTPAGKGPYAGILFMHWLGQPNGNREEFMDESLMLAQRGTVSLLIQGIFPWTEAPTNGEHDRQQVVQQVIELRRALDLLLSQPGVDPQRIGYVGHDYGALYGGILAGVEKRIKTYVLMAGLGTFSDWSLKYFPGTRNQDPETYRQALKVVDPIGYVAHAAPASLFNQFARNDSFIPDGAAQAFFNAGSEPKQMESYDAPHSLDSDEARRARADWLSQQLHLSSAP